LNTVPMIYAAPELSLPKTMATGTIVPNTCHVVHHDASQRGGKHRTLRHQSRTVCAETTASVFILRRRVPLVFLAQTVPHPLWRITTCMTGHGLILYHPLRSGADRALVRKSSLNQHRLSTGGGTFALHLTHRPSAGRANLLCTTSNQALAIPLVFWAYALG
jgi:hypothetical protein